MKISDILLPMFMFNTSTSTPFRIVNALFILIASLLEHNSTIILRTIKNFWMKKNEQSCSISAYLSFKNNILHDSNISSIYYAVQECVYDVVTKNKDIDFDVIDYTNSCCHSEKNRIVSLSSNKMYKIAPNIFISQKKEIRDSNCTKEDKTYITYTYEIFSRPKNYATIQTFLDNCMSSYQQQKNELEQHVFVLKEFESLNHPIYTKYPLETFKTFDNLFFDQKEELLNRIDNFVNNKHIYELTGMPYTFGLMLHGEPGGGKTSTIKAIAKFTNRHIVQIHLSKITTREQLQSIFMDQQLNYHMIPNTKRLYVFEEIDCGTWKQLFNSRTIECKSSQYKSKVPDPKITLGDFLEMIDGIVEISGRMLIMSTNNISHIDSALIRPGRIDMAIEFGKMCPKDIAAMYHLWFKTEIPVENIKAQLTQAELGNLFSTQNKTYILQKLYSSSS